MANRVAALIGPGRGPRVSTRGISRPHIRIRQLTCGGSVRVLAGDQIMVFKEDGLHPIMDAAFVIVEHEGKSKNLICIIIGEAA